MSQTLAPAAMVGDVASDGGRGRLRLDDLYRMTAFIYHDANLGRGREATLLHFVEVCGMLTLPDRKRRRDRTDVTGALCKALGWYFPLLAKMRVDSVEQLIFTKFPGVCPYCRKAPHVESDCKLVKGTDQVLSHERVRELTRENWDARPPRLNEWQAVFGRIYPRALSTGAFSSIALLEELGELADLLSSVQDAAAAAAPNAVGNSAASVHPSTAVGTFGMLMGGACIAVDRRHCASAALSGDLPSIEQAVRHHRP